MFTFAMDGADSSSCALSIRDTCRETLQLWDMTTKERMVLSHAGFSRAFAGLSVNRDYDSLLKHCLQLNYGFVSLDEVARSLITILEDEEFGYSLNRIYVREKISPSQLFKIISERSALRSSVIFLVKHGVTDFSYRQLTPPCIAVLQYLDDFLNDKSVDSAQTAWVGAALKKVIAVCDGKLSVAECIHELLEEGELMQHLHSPFVKRVHDALAGPNATIDRVIECLDMRFAGSINPFTVPIYLEVYQSRIDEHLSTSNPDSAADALIAARLASVGSDIISLQTLLSDPVLATNISQLAKKMSPREISELVQLDEPFRTEIMQAYSCILRWTSKADCRRAIELATNRSEESLIVRKILPLIHSPSQMKDLLTIFAPDYSVTNLANCPALFPQSIMIKARWFMQLGLTDKEISLLTEDSERGRCFANAVSIVEEKTRTLSSKDNYQKLLPEYYRQIFQAIHYELTRKLHVSISILDRCIHEAELPLKNALKNDHYRSLRITLKLVSNMVVLPCTLSAANLIHKRSTGDFFFFSRPRTCEHLQTTNRKLNNHVMSVSSRALHA